MEGKVLFAAAQVPFETSGLHFCTLVPLCSIDGEPVNAKAEFPTTGLCWFMLRDVRFQGLTPGQLVVGPVEPTRDWQSSAPDKHWYQLKVETAQMAGSPDTVLEVIEAGAEVPEGPRVLISPKREIRMDHRPTDLVIVRLGQKFYGPFRAKARNDDGGGWRVTLERLSQNRIWQAEESTIAKVGGLISTQEIRVSLEDAPPSKASSTRTIRYSFIPWSRFEKLRQAGAVDIELLTDAEILGQIARDHLKPKAKRQQLQQLLKELDTSIQNVPDLSARVAIATAKHLSEQLAASEKLGEELLETLMASGALDTRIQELNEKRFEDYVESRAAAAQSRISERARELQKQHDALSTQVAELNTLLKRERDEKRAAFDAEIKGLRAKAEEEIEKERQHLSEQRQALHREQKTLEQAVSQAAARFGAGRSELLSDLLALLPALQATGVLQPPAGAQPTPPTVKQPAAIMPLPAPFATSHTQSEQRLDEREFFERFANHVQASGFRYRDADLKAFHLSAKCTDLTILTGLSGIGKSSLVRLYAEALAGEDPAARARLLTVDVSPSWTEPQDILGSVNLLDRQFEPASCGLFHHLLAAAREHEQAGSRSGIVLVALDEMNLAQVEHYFAGFIQALERPAPRCMAVFDQSALEPENPLREFARLPLPPTLRLIGTVNFDETTRSLSQRLKDRAAILELNGERHAGLQQLNSDDLPMVQGAPALLADVQAWLGGEGQLPVEVGTLLDDINPLLVRLGAPITARRARAIRRLFAAGSPLLTVEQVLDVAIATRVLPLLRGLDRRSAQEDIGRVLELLASAPGGCRDSCQRLSSMLSQEKDVWQEVLEDE